ncbi:hypothetical protein EES39_05830 [Streptomyces sp. ADI92-24]|nr:hypothetical protein EES39_05830 [Streptomyces sp. ADI92-24]
MRHHESADSGGDRDVPPGPSRLKHADLGLLGRHTVTDLPTPGRVPKSADGPAAVAEATCPRSGGDAQRQPHRAGPRSEP